jgi:hypothetical protein
VKDEVECLGARAVIAPVDVADAGAVFAAIRDFLADLIRVALRDQVIVLDQPDPQRVFDAPKLPTPEVKGVVVYGPDHLGSTIESAIRPCFVTKWTTKSFAPDDLGAYYNANDPPKKIVWLAFGSAGSPFQTPTGCSDQMH